MRFCRSSFDLICSRRNSQKGGRSSLSLLRPSGLPFGRAFYGSAGILGWPSNPKVLVDVVEAVQVGFGRPTLAMQLSPCSDGTQTISLHPIRPIPASFGATGVSPVLTCRIRVTYQPITSRTRPRAVRGSCGAAGNSGPRTTGSVSTSAVARRGYWYMAKTGILTRFSCFLSAGC